MPPDKERIERERLAGLPLSKLIRELADMHIGDGDDVGVLARALLERVDRLAWTTDEPTQSGSYWWIYYDDGPSVIELDEFGEWFRLGYQGPFVPQTGSYFSGPILYPGRPLEVPE